MNYYYEVEVLRYDTDDELAKMLQMKRAEGRKPIHVGGEYGISRTLHRKIIFEVEDK